MDKITEFALRDFHAGTNYKAYELFGAHKHDDIITFRVWAPNADAVYLVGDFNSWCETDKMERISSNGVYEYSLKAEILYEKPLYKYKIINGSKTLFKADPYANFMQKAPDTASIYYESNTFKWSDKHFLSQRKSLISDGIYTKPVNIYEVHLGSYMRHADGSYMSYGELAAELASYAKKMSYTHVELMPVMEHPNDASWGYQICGYYAPTSRFGTPDDFRSFVNTLHCAGVGVILDWVPAHFPKDEHGLFEFDGAPLYEYKSESKMENKVWGTRYFDISKPEVMSFLISNAIYFAKEFHVDGFRVDAVSSMLYLDYGKKKGEWKPNKHGGNINFEAVAFLKKLNKVIKELCPDVLMIAEESTAFKNITGSYNNGIGFDLKWNMGWMNDSLSYICTEPQYRKHVHNKLTFPLMYAFSEKYVLPISHDEVVYGKKSLLDKMPGDYEMKFAGMRAYLVYMMTQSGKKLSFMSNQFGQFAEWNYNGSVEWFMLEFEKHRQLHDFTADLNALYLARSELWELDCGWEGFEWVQCDRADDSIIAYKRKNASGNELLCVISFTDNYNYNYEIKAENGIYKVILSSDDKIYGGSGKIDIDKISVIADSKGDSFIRLDLPPHAALIFEKHK